MSGESSENDLLDNPVVSMTEKEFIKSMEEQLEKAKAIAGPQNSDLDSNDEEGSEDEKDDVSEDKSEILQEASSQINVTQNISKPPNAEMRWVKSFNLTYGSKMPYKIVNVEGDNLHYQLRCMENEARESRDYKVKESVPNYVVAHVGFVVSDRAWVKDGPHGRRFISVPIKFSGQDFTHVTKVYKFDEVKHGERKLKKGGTQKVKYSRSTGFLADLLTHSPAQKHEEIKGYYQKADRFFSDYFHHSERGLWGGLNNPTIRAHVLQEVAQVLPAGGKIYCLVWDLHSTNYLCKDCDPSSFIVQDKVGKIFQEELMQKGYKFSDKPLISFTRVSAEVCGGRSQKLLGHHYENYAKDIRNFRTEGLTVVLQRDDRTSHANQRMMGAHGFFVSSEKKPKQSMAVYVTRQRDTESRALKVTDHNSKFANRLAENEQKISALILKAVQEKDAAKFDDALKTIQEAYMIDEEHVSMLDAYAFILFLRGEFLEAFPYAKKAYEGYKAKQDLESAKRCLDNLYRCYRPKAIEMVNGLIAKESFEEAFDILEEIWAIDNDFWQARLLMIPVLEKMEKIDDALELTEFIINYEECGAEIEKLVLEDRKRLLLKKQPAVSEEHKFPATPTMGRMSSE